jgi:hypothetical protein
MKHNFPNSPWWTYVEAIEALDAEYRAKRGHLRAVLQVEQTKCTHPKTTYHPDPSGNNDSFTKCDVCGKEL